MMEPIGFATRYGRLGASSRLRHFAWAERLAKEEHWQVDIQSFFSDAYLEKLYSGGGKSRLAALAALWRRDRWLKRAPRNLVVEYELLPFVGWKLEERRWRGRRVAVDFDDNVWDKYAASPRLADKFDRIVRRAGLVIAANDFLMKKALRLNPSTIKIPTPVAWERYPEPGAAEKFPRFTVAWIGTPVTYRELETAAPALRSMARAADFELLAIARAGLSARPLAGVPVRWVDWSPEEEAPLLARCHAGIMPLEDNAFNRGKSAYKLIQYAAAGLPAIATPLGENLKVVDDKITGFLAQTPEEWAEALRQLVRDEALRRQMGGAARQKAWQYSYEANYPRYRDALRATFSATP